MSNSEKIAKDARDDFDLGGELHGRAVNSDGIVVYTDDVTGKKHKRVVALIDLTKSAERPAFTDPETGTVLIEAVPLDTERLADLEEQRATLEAELERTAIEFEWTAVPQIIVDKARRESANIYGDNRGQQKQDDYDAYFTAFLLSEAVTKYTVRRVNHTSAGLSLKNAQALKGFLPPTEYQRLDHAYAATQYERSIEHEATSNPDF